MNEMTIFSRQYIIVAVIINIEKLRLKNLDFWNFEIPLLNAWQSAIFP